MQTHRLGNSGMHITPIGFGAWAIGGGDWSFGWGPQDDADSIAAIHEALDAGINWIDTAAVYGLGHSEEVVARALNGRTGRPYIFTKCSMTWNDRGEIVQTMKAQSIRRECEASLRRLNVDAIDLYQIHWPEPDGEIEEGWSTLAELKRQGKVRHIGVSNFSVDQMKRVQRIAPITSLQPPYSLIDRHIEQDILPYAQRQGIGVMAYSPMACGLLTGSMTRERISKMPDNDWRRRWRHFREPRLSRNLMLVDLLRTIGARHRRSPAEVAIAWVLRHPAVTGAIAGARRLGQIAGLIGAAALRLNQQDLDEIDTFLATHPEPIEHPTAVS